MRRISYYSSARYYTCLWLYDRWASHPLGPRVIHPKTVAEVNEAASPSVLVQYSHLTGPLVGVKREKFDVYWFIGPLFRQVFTFDLTNKMLMHVNKNVV